VNFHFVSDKAFLIKNSQKSNFSFGINKKVIYDSQNYTKNLFYYVSQSDSTVYKSFYFNILKLISRFFGNSAILPRKDFYVIF